MEGKRGESWVVVQFLLFAAFFFAPQLELPFPAAALTAGRLLMAAGMISGLYGFLHIGRHNMTAFPKPGDKADLMSSGPYACVRHPIYGAVFLLFLGWGLWRAHALRIVIALALFVFFGFKAKREEQYLVERFPEYAAYRQRVRRKMLPLIY